MKYLRLSIDNPCNEDWDKMSVVEQGRKCEKCNRVLQDFSNKSDKEIIDIIRNTGKICGRVNPSQLNRDIPMEFKTPRKPFFINRISPFLLSLGGLTLTQNAMAQNPSIVKTAIDKDSSDYSIVKGVVTDKEDRPISTVRISIKGSTAFTYSDDDGLFRLKIPSNQIGNDKITLLAEPYSNDSTSILENTIEYKQDSSYTIKLPIKSQEIRYFIYGYMSYDYDKTPRVPAPKKKSFLKRLFRRP